MPQPDAPQAPSAAADPAAGPAGSAVSGPEGPDAAVPTAAHRALERAFPWVVGALVPVLAILVLFGTNPGPPWQVAPTQVADGNVLVDDEPVPAGDRASLAGQLRPGVVVEHAGFGDLVLVAPGAYVLEVTPGTRLVLPDTPPRWFGRGGLTGRVDEGCVRMTTGAGFGGARLRLATPDGEVECRGGTVAVSRDSGGTRVELLEGEARLRGTATAPGAPVAAGAAAILARGAPPAGVPLSDGTREDLERLRNARGALLGEKRAR